MLYQRTPKPPTALGHRFSRRECEPLTRQQRAEEAKRVAKATASKRARADQAWIAWRSMRCCGELCGLLVHNAVEKASPNHKTLLSQAF
jgi:hypothetical protein